MKKIYLLQVTLSNSRYFILYVEMEVIYIKPSQNILVVENYSFQKTIVSLSYKTIVYCRQNIVILKLTIVFFGNYSFPSKTIIFKKL
jgi:hypothetical protein